MARARRNPRQDVESAVRAHFVGKMDKRTKKLLEAAKWDLYYGPATAKDVGLKGYTYTRAINELNDWWSDNGGDVWYDRQADIVEESEPQAYEEDGELVEPFWEDYVEVDSSTAKRWVFGRLISDGGM
jgi:hypothetical protein